MISKSVDRVLQLLPLLVFGINVLTGVSGSFSVRLRLLLFFSLPMSSLNCFMRFESSLSSLSSDSVPESVLIRSPDMLRSLKAMNAYLAFRAKFTSIPMLISVSSNTFEIMQVWLVS